MARPYHIRPAGAISHDSGELVYELFTLLWDCGGMDANFSRKGQAPATRPDLPSLLADTAARQFRSPTAMIQAQELQKDQERMPGNVRDERRPGSFSAEVADTILSGGKPL